MVSAVAVPPKAAEPINSVTPTPPAPARLERKSPRTMIREWIEKEVSGQSHVDIPALANAACDHFAKDREFVREYLRREMRPYVAIQIRAIVSTSRSPRPTPQRQLEADTVAPTSLIVVGDEAITPGELRRRSLKLRSKFSEWMEHVGDRGHVRLMDMRKSDLQIAINERLNKGITEIRIAALWQRVADQLSDDQTVRDRFTPEDIDAIEMSVNIEEGTYGDLRLQSQPIHALPGDTPLSGQTDGRSAA